MSVRDAIQDSVVSTSEQVSGGIPYPACVTPAAAGTGWHNRDAVSAGSGVLQYRPGAGEKHQMDAEYGSLWSVRRADQP